MRTMRKRKWTRTGSNSCILLCTRFVLAIFGLTACNSVAPTAWIGKDTPDDIGEGVFPKLSDIPERPVLSDSAQDRYQMAADLAAEWDRVEREAQKLREGGVPTEVRETGAAP